MPQAGRGRGMTVGQGEALRRPGPVSKSLTDVEQFCSDFDSYERRMRLREMEKGVMIF